MMAKNFPFFKFIATEWLTGDIVYEQLELQGLFINVCALYWHRDGKLSMDDLVKRYKNENLIEKLVPDFIKNNDGQISISFLDEQLIDASHISKVNSANGSGGGRPQKVTKKGMSVFYILKCYLNGEEFYKAGITGSSVARRFSTSTGANKKIPYNFEVVLSKELEMFFALKLESLVRKNFKRYSPKLHFSGHKECYEISDNLLQYVESQIAKTEIKPIKSENKPKKSKEEEEEEEEQELEQEKESDKEVEGTTDIVNCLDIALKDSRWIKASKATKELLEDFNKVLEERGIYKKLPIDYKTHFANWKKKLPVPLKNKETFSREENQW